MVQFLSVAIVLGIAVLALGVIVAALRDHADAIAHALAGRSLKAAILEKREASAHVSRALRPRGAAVRVMRTRLRAAA